MTVTLKLKPEEVAVLTAHANKEGVDLETVLHRFIARQIDAENPDIPEKNKAAIALFQSWLAERDEANSEELARRDAELEEFKANINRWRAEEGRPPAYP